MHWLLHKVKSSLLIHIDQESYFIWKPVISFAEQNKRLVSIWNATLGNFSNFTKSGFHHMLRNKSKTTLKVYSVKLKKKKQLSNFLITGKAQLLFSILIETFNESCRWSTYYTLRWTYKIVRLPSPDRPNAGAADSKYFIGPLKAKFFWAEKHFLR